MRQAAATLTPPITTAIAAIRPIALTEAEASCYTGAKVSYLRAARIGRCDGPPYVRMGRAVRYSIADLDAWLLARRVGGREGK